LAIRERGKAIEDDANEKAAKLKGIAYVYLV